MLRLLLAAMVLPLGWAQSRIEPAEARVIQSRGNRASLACQVTAIRPFLNFSLRLQTGYIFRYSGSGHELTVLTAVAPDNSATPAYFLDRIQLPQSPTDAQYEATGSFFLGAGHYHVDWLLSDESGRACHKQWDLTAELARGDRGMKLAMPPGIAMDVSLHGVAQTGRSAAATSRRITVLLDAAPISRATAGNPMAGAGLPFQRDAGGRELPPLPPLGDDPVTPSILGPRDQALLMGALSALLEQFPDAAIRLVVFNLEQQKELYRRDGFRLENLHQIAEVLRQIQLATIDYRILRNRTGHIDLLASLTNQELRAEPRPDAVIFLGPRERFHDNFPDGLLDPHPGPKPHFFFLAYQVPGRARGGIESATPDAGTGGIDLPDTPSTLARSGGVTLSSSPLGLSDTVSKEIGKLKGKTMTIESPRDFAKALKAIGRSF